VLTDGSRHELERPELVPGEALVWHGAGPEARYPDQRIPLADVVSLEGVQPKASSLSGGRVYDAALVAAGVILWGLILWGIFA
jgi:hypothetical protein